jgi:N-hydroxyarylamine O-acetyltransferase
MMTVTVLRLQELEMAGIDLEAYFQRIGHDGERSSTLETLKTLHRRHAEAIPFENLDSLLKRPVRLDLPSIAEKLVHNRRGGYCFEQNLLFRSVLEALGFSVTGLGARVVWNAPEDAIRARSHMLLRVEIEGRSWLADVGFGGQTLTGPLLLETDIEQPTPHEQFRLVRRQDEFLMQSRIREKWMPLYRFDLCPQQLPDYEVSNWHVSTHPDSIFVNGLMASRVAAGVRYALMNNELAVHHTGANTEKRLLKNAAELRQTLEEVIGLTLPDSPNLEATLERLTSSS